METKEKGKPPNYRRSSSALQRRLDTQMVLVCVSRSRHPSSRHTTRTSPREQAPCCFLATIALSKRRSRRSRASIGSSQDGAAERYAAARRTSANAARTRTFFAAAASTAAHSLSRARTRARTSATLSLAEVAASSHTCSLTVYAAITLEKESVSCSFLRAAAPAGLFARSIASRTSAAKDVV